MDFCSFLVLGCFFMQGTIKSLYEESYSMRTGAVDGLTDDADDTTEDVSEDATESLLW